MIELTKILVPTDFSDCSAKALQYGLGLADKFGAQVCLLHVLELHSTSTPAFGAGLALTTVERESRTTAETKLNQLAAEYQEAGMTLDCVTVPGNPSTEINRYATDNEFDLIVIGTHGRTGLSRTFMGSVAETVVRRAPCLVMTVQPHVTAGLVATPG